MHTYIEAFGQYLQKKKHTHTHTLGMPGDWGAKHNRCDVWKVRRFDKIEAFDMISHTTREKSARKNRRFLPTHKQAFLCCR